VSTGERRVVHGREEPVLRPMPLTLSAGIAVWSTC
jgi:hypothetical protein